MSEPNDPRADSGGTERMAAMADHPPSPVEPVGMIEIAERLGVRRQTVQQWRFRGLLPDPAWTISGDPAWDWAVIEHWARETGRLDGAS